MLNATACAGGKLMAKRLAKTAGACAGRITVHVTTALDAAASTATATDAHSGHRAARASRLTSLTEIPFAAGVVDASSVSKRATAAESSRRLGSFSRQRRSNVRID